MASMYTTHSPHTDICVPDNGGMPSVSTEGLPRSIRSSGVIFREVLLRSGSHRPRLAWRFKQRVLSPSTLLSYRVKHTTPFIESQVYSLFFAPAFFRRVFRQSLRDLRIFVFRIAGILHVAATVFVDQLGRCFGRSGYLPQRWVDRLLFAHLLTPLRLGCATPLLLFAEVCGKMASTLAKIPSEKRVLHV